MRVRSSPAELLLRLPHQLDPEAQSGLFRQALTALAQQTEALGPPPLDGIEAPSIESAAHVILERGLIHELDFIAPGSAAVALYELSSACRAGQVKRDLRRKVFSLLYEGNAASFSPVASRMALGSAGPLATPTLRARVALCLDLPLGSEINISPLALALCTRSETHPEWVTRPSTGALPRRRLAAKLFEQAAREAVFRHQLGDPQPRNLLLLADARAAFQRLLDDREPLVWRHAAVAKGLLASIHKQTREEVEQALAPDLTITHWRRAAVALVASTVSGDEEAIRSVQAVLEGQLPEQDRGLPAAMVMGLPPLVDAEPERASALLERFAALGRADVAFAVSELLAQTRSGQLDAKAIEPMRRALTERGRGENAAERSLTARAVRRLTLEGDNDDLAGRVKQALLAFESQSAPAAYRHALEALNEAHEIAGFVESNSPTDEKTLGASIGALVDLDAGAFARPTLVNLLLLARKPGDPAGHVEQYERLQNRTSRWILDGVDQAGRSAWSRESAVADQRRLRVLLHLVDADGAGRVDGSPLVPRLQRSIRVLLQRLAEGPDAMVHRVLCAALARSFDAAVREGVSQASDLVLVVAMTLTDHYSVETIAEACTSPDVSDPLSALSRFVSPDLLDASETTDTTTGILHDPALVSDEEVAEKLRYVARVMSLSQGLLGGGGYHAEALRRVFFRLGRSLELVAVARGLSELVEPRESGAPVLEELHLACEELARMVRCAELRVVGFNTDRPSVEFDSAGLRGVVERGLANGTQPTAEEVAASAEQLVLGLPEPVAQAIVQVAFGVHQLPLHSEAASRLTPMGQRRAPLPNWLLPRRVIGPFYVIRPLGSGGVSSVFMARRIEDRNNPDAEAFAVKVPEYDPATARSMSEGEFFQMFREEAGALLSLPAHANLARFVTFDLSARPKPILVMELIRGTPLDRLVESRSLTMPRVIAYLDGILSGLEAMHGVGVGHLDVKASNVILRDGNTPVLVDFGLSGRTLRPGCGTVEYTSPEVLGVAPPDHSPSPPPADVYSFGCLAYEMLTRRQLFEAQDELQLVTKHVSHDGWLSELAQIDSIPGLELLSRVIASCLRHDPRNRPTVSQLREQLTRALVPLADAPWPLNLEAQAATG